MRCGLIPTGSRLPGAICAVCEDYPPDMDRVVVGTDFVPPWSGLIASLKFRQQPASALPLVDMLVAAILAPCAGANASHMPDLIVPIPLARTRWQERGFNQAWWLAQQTATRLGLANRLHPHTLLRRHDTGRLMSMRASERVARIHGAFEVAACGRHRVEGQHVAIVDDVMTTGATANEASRCLLDAGAASVTGWFAARTPAPQRLERDHRQDSNQRSSCG